jgi:GntR family transcriptional regulator
MVVTRTRSAPLHEQIRQMIETQIRSGHLQPGDRLFTEKEYAAQFGVSLAPVRQALLDLASSGHVVRVKGRGTFVRDSSVVQSITLLSSFTDSLRAQGIDFRIVVLALGRVRADPPIAALLGIRRGAAVVRLKRLALIRGEPAALLDAYLPADRFGALLAVQGWDEGRSLYRALETEFGTRVGGAHNSLEVVRCDDEEATLLDVPRGAPALQVNSVTLDSVGRPIEASWVLYRADRYRFAIDSTRAISRQPVTSDGHPPEEAQHE